jgi:serine phosphatase RsbU (regulator of sigma subunit)
MAVSRPSHRKTAAAFLVPISGPPLEMIELHADRAATNGLTIGRHTNCDLLLPDPDKVSRSHARFNLDQGSTVSQWRLTDLNSRWGTFLNGIRVQPGQQMPLSEGDLIRITPWTFSFTSQARRGGLLASDDTGQTVVRTMSLGSEDRSPRGLHDEMLGLLLESAAAIHSASDEKQLAELVIDAAVRGTGLNNAALLRPLDAQGHLEVIASRFAPVASQHQPPTFSRSLINAAAQGQVAELSGVGGISSDGDIGQSIVTMKISAALCVPLMLGGAPAAFLYLDRREAGLAQTVRPGSSAFCAALGRMASLALANLKRIDIERRQAQFEAELRAAAVAQKWILPRRNTRVGRFQCIGESRAGRYIGGDFFDVIDLGADRLAVALGDVSGKGVAASVLMTATQGFLHAALSSSVVARSLAEGAARAVTAANDFVHPRKPEGKFVTLWVGVFDFPNRRLSYVDAGHSYATLGSAGDGSFTALDVGEGLPLGVEQQITYVAESVPLPESGTVLVVSDGIVEQPAAVSEASTDRFNMPRVRESLSESLASNSSDPVAALFDAVVRYAGTDQFADDATAVLVRW